MSDGKSNPGFRWVGPFRLRDYLELSIDPNQVWPQEAPGVYVVTRDPWEGVPSTTSHVLYVGGNPYRADYFRQRIGFLVKDMLGFWGDAAGSHVGGQSLWTWCSINHVHPLDLYLGWVVGIECVRCTETDLYARLQPELSRIAPARCHGHAPVA